MESGEGRPKRGREDRFLSCSVETQEELEEYIDQQETNSISPQQKDRRSSSRANKQLLSKTQENRNKTYGFVPRVKPRSSSQLKLNDEKNAPIQLANEEDRSPPAKVQKCRTMENDKELSESDKEIDESTTNIYEELENELLMDGNTDSEVKDDTECENKEEEMTTKEDKTIENETITDDTGKSTNETELEPETKKKCVDCEKMYSENKKDESKRKCQICKYNEHGCTKEQLGATSKGDRWLCGECITMITVVQHRHPDFFDFLLTTIMKKNPKTKETNVNKKNSGLSTETEETQKKETKGTRSALRYQDMFFEDEDLRSLNDGNWISDTIIAFWFTYLEEIIYKNNQNILFIPPSITHLLKEGFLDEYDMILEPLNIWQRKYILLAVNDNKVVDNVEKVGGQHWSLLVYTIRDNTWYHYDSMNNSNIGEARFLVGRLQEYIRPGSTPNITNAHCTQQNNNYDCGAYTMVYAQKIANILTGEHTQKMAINPCSVEKEEVNNVRDKVRGMITNTASPVSITITTTETIDLEKRKENKEEKNKEHPKGKPCGEGNVVPKDLKDPKKFPNLNKNQICHFLTKGKCRYGASGENQLGKCKRYHPEQCRLFNLNGTMEKGCKKGDNCENWHPTYFCHLSINSKKCSRVDCYFKHHKNCKVTYSNNNDFLEPRNQNGRHMRHPGQQKYMARWQHNQQQHYHHQQFPQLGNRPNKQIPMNQLTQVIQSVIYEMNRLY